MGPVYLHAWAVPPQRHAPATAALGRLLAHPCGGTKQTSLQKDRSAAAAQSPHWKSPRTGRPSPRVVSIISLRGQVRADACHPRISTAFPLSRSNDMPRLQHMRASSLPHCIARLPARRSDISSLVTSHIHFHCCAGTPNEKLEVGSINSSLFPKQKLSHYSSPPTSA